MTSARCPSSFRAPTPGGAEAYAANVGCPVLVTVAETVLPAACRGLAARTRLPSRCRPPQNSASSGHGSGGRPNAAAARLDHSWHRNGTGRGPARFHPRGPSASCGDPVQGVATWAWRSGGAFGARPFRGDHGVAQRYGEAGGSAPVRGLQLSWRRYEAPRSRRFSTVPDHRRRPARRRRGRAHRFFMAARRSLIDCAAPRPGSSAPTEELTGRWRRGTIALAPCAAFLETARSRVTRPAQAGPRRSPTPLPGSPPGTTKRRGVQPRRPARSTLGSQSCPIRLARQNSDPAARRQNRWRRSVRRPKRGLRLRNCARRRRAPVHCRGPSHPAGMRGDQGYGTDAAGQPAGGAAKTSMKVGCFRRAAIKRQQVAGPPICAPGEVGCTAAVQQRCRRRSGARHGGASSRFRITGTTCRRLRPGTPRAWRGRPQHASGEWRPAPAAFVPSPPGVKVRGPHAVLPGGARGARCHLNFPPPPPLAAGLVAVVEEHLPPEFAGPGGSSRASSRAVGTGPAGRRMIAGAGGMCTEADRT